MKNSTYPEHKAVLPRTSFLIKLRAACVGLFLSGMAMAGMANAQDWEQYGTTGTGVTLRWKVFTPGDGLPHPAILVLHPGGFKTGIAGPDFVSMDLAAAGFVAFSTEYRLAPPHSDMNAAMHGPTAQDSVFPVDDGHYPSQTDDVQMAIRAARIDPRCDGRVYGIGGSAGASHVLYMMATGTPGDDQFDLGVSLSNPCKYDDVPWLQQPCISGETCGPAALENYLGIPAGSALDHLPELAAASPTTYVTASLPPYFFLYSDHDSSFLETYQRDDLINTMQAAGLTESTAAIPELGKYKQLLVATGEGNYHAFEFWNLPIDLNPGSPLTKDVVIAWLQAGVPPKPDPTPTPPPDPTPTPTPTPAAPVITSQPTAKFVNVGETAWFGVTATGDTALTYQWRQNGVDIVGATGATYTTPATVATDSGSLFSVVVTNDGGSVTSNDALLTVKIPPGFKTQPRNQTAKVGANATFSVTTTGTNPLTYQWRKNGVNFSGATKRIYTTPAVTRADNGAKYSVVVTNSVGSATSNNAILTVK